MSKSRSELVASFLAVLEMAKNGRVVLKGENENLYVQLDLKGENTAVQENRD